MSAYVSSPYFTSILLNDGNKPFWSDLSDGYVLKDITFNINTLLLSGSISGNNNGEKYIFNIIPKNLNGHKININFTNNTIINTPNLQIENFNNGYINLSGSNNSISTINSITNIINNNSEITFTNINFKQTVSGLNCNNLIFKNCIFNNSTIFNNCNVQILTSNLSSTLSGINNSQIYIKDSNSSENLKYKALSNSQITWNDNTVLTNYKSYIVSGQFNNLSSCIGSSLYFGTELTDQNALANHFHQYSEYLIPSQYINTTGITSSYLDTLPIGSVIFWPEFVRKAKCDSDTDDDVNKRNKNIPSELSSKNYVCYTPLLTGSYERCNGESLAYSGDKHILSILIRNKFSITSTDTIVKPNLVSEYLLDNVSNDKFNELYPFYKYTVGNNINQTIQFRYVARWASGFGQEHNGNVERDHEVIIENKRLTLNAYYKSKGKKENLNFRGGQCVIFAIDIPSSNFDDFISNKNIVFQGYSTTCIYDTTTNGTTTKRNPENLCGIKLLNYECLKALFVSQRANLSSDKGLFGSITMESKSNRPDEGINPSILNEEFPVELSSWFILHKNDSEGSDLSDPIRRISYFNFSNTTWTTNSLDFTYDNEYNLWKLDGFKLKENLNKYKFSIDNCYRFYCMAYINNIKSTIKNLTISNFNIVNKVDNSSIYSFYIFGSNDYGNGIGNWHYDQRYNVFYSYAINGNRIW